MVAVLVPTAKEVRPVASPQFGNVVKFACTRLPVPAGQVALTLQLYAVAAVSPLSDAEVVACDKVRLVQVAEAAVL